MNRAQACSCGGHLKKALVERVDIAPLFGLRGVFEGPISGLRCDRCGGETFDADVIDRMLIGVGRVVLSQPRILSADEARFLRKVVLGATQDHLAKLMGINKITIADWERGERSMSKEHDYELRGIALSSLLARLSPGARKRLSTILQDVAEILMAPRLSKPPKRPKPYFIPASHLTAA